MGEERRRAVRIKSTLFIQYCLGNTANNAWDISTVKDISESGVCILTGRRFEKDSTIALRLRLPSRPFEAIQIYGRVVDSTSAGYAGSFITRIEFKNLKEDIQILFHEYVRWIINSEKK